MTDEKTGKIVDLAEMKKVIDEAAAQEMKQFEPTPPPREKEGADPLNSKEVIYGLQSNEDGDAYLYNISHTYRFIYDHAAGTWHEWQGDYWAEDETGQAGYAINYVIDGYGREADRQGKKELKLTKAKATQEVITECQKTRKELLKRIRLLQTAARKRNVLFLATLANGLTGREWDKNPWLLGCENGVVELKTGKLRPGKQEDYIKTVAPAECKGLEQEAPIWNKFLKDTFNGDQDLVDYLQRLLGYGITGLKREHVLPILWGRGRNGKGTFLETIKYVLGPLAHKCKAEILLDTGRFKPSGSADADTLAFRGKRIIFAAETSERSRLNTGKIKELAGGDTLNARAPYGRRPIEFEPTHLLLLMTNNKPQIPAADYATWQRIHLIPFTLSFIDKPDTKKNERLADKKLPEKLKKEAPGILAWLIKGCLSWQEKGLNPPESVIQATKKYQKEMDFISQWIDEKCIIDNNARMKAGEGYKSYRLWCEDLGHKLYSGTRFGKDMKERFDWEKSTYVFYIGIGLETTEKMIEY